jgi:pimeloyl-ACP methyl ester carboxylesterase
MWMAAALVLAAVVVGWLVRSYEAKLAFFPTRGEDATPGAYGAPFTPMTVATTDGERLRVWHLTHEKPRARVVYFHGNGGNLSLWSDILVAIARRGFEVVAFDYRGYGLSTGTPSEQGLYRDVEAVLGLVHDRLRRSDIPLVYWGRSLGSTTAAYAATLREPHGVIVEAGFPSMRAVVRSNPILWALSWFSSYQFPTAAFLAATRAPVLVIHGDSDSVIPYALGQQLYAGLPNGSQFVTIRDGDHNDAEPRDAETYWAAIDRFVAAAR